MIVACATATEALPTAIDDFTAQASILFHSHMAPDYTVVGFNLTVEQVKAPDQHWWFLLVQHPTAPRFGLAITPDLSTAHDHLDWADFASPSDPTGRFLSASRSFAVPDDNSTPRTVIWPGHAGITARILQMNPIIAAFRARPLIDPVPS